jgi:hypothetical protein
MKMTRDEAIDLMIEAATALGWIVVTPDVKDNGKPEWILLGTKKSIKSVLAGECNGEIK